MFSSNKNPHKTPQDAPRRKGQRLNPSYVFSGILVSVSFMTSLIPFAVYGVSQIAALAGKRAAFGVFGVSFLFLAVLGFILGSPLFLSAAMTAVITAPFLAVGIALRERSASRMWAVLVMLIPVFLCIGATSFSSPQTMQNNIAQFRAALSGESETPAVLQESLQNQKPMITQTQRDELKTQFDSFFSKPDVVTFVSSSPWERLLWFVFGPGNTLFFSLLLIAFANVAFLDIAYEQVARLRAVATYVSSRKASFAESFVHAVVSAVSLSRLRKGQDGPQLMVVKHEDAFRLAAGRVSQAGRFGILSQILQSFVRPKHLEHQVLMKNMIFTLSGSAHSWNLRRFRPSTVLSCLSVLCVASMGLSFGTYQGMMASLSSSPFLIPLSLASVLAFVMLSILSLKGMFIVYTRLVPFLGIVVLCLSFVFGSGTAFGPFFLIAFFSTVALLESVYSSKKT